MCITNWGKLVLQTWAALFVLSQNGAASLLQLDASVVTNWGSYYKLGQPLLQNKQLLQIGAKCITNWGRYYKLG